MKPPIYPHNKPQPHHFILYYNNHDYIFENINKDENTMIKSEFMLKLQMTREFPLQKMTYYQQY